VIIRIPLRTKRGQPITINPGDIQLQTGDVVFVEAAPVEKFYTGGLLPTGEYVLPRDYDLDVLEAVSRVRGPLINGAFGGSNLSGTLIRPGIGGPSPRQLSVVRQTPDGGQVTINVDLFCALRNPRERLLIKSGDVLILQESRNQAMARYFTEQFNVLSTFRFINHRDATGAASFVLP
jgi:hypothetical protein